MGSEDNAAVTPLRGSGASLAGAARMLLDPRLAATAGNLGPGLGVMSTVALVALVDDHGLVDQRLIHGNVEDSIVQFDAI
jgi:hypothetical protein